MKRTLSMFAHLCFWFFWITVIVFAAGWATHTAWEIFLYGWSLG